LTHVKSCGWQRQTVTAERKKEKRVFIISLHFRTIINLFRLSKMSFYFIYVFLFVFFFSRVCRSAYVLSPSRDDDDGKKLLLLIISEIIYFTGGI
jgi:hypothetical protein